MDDMEKLEKFVKVAIWCIQGDPSLRPNMKKVTHMLDGVVDVPIPPCPSPFYIYIYIYQNVNSAYVYIYKRELDMVEVKIKQSLSWMLQALSAVRDVR
jgi:hypothetical protein